MMKRLVLALGAVILAVRPGSAYVEAIYPLQQVLNESEVVAEGVIEKVDRQNHTAVMRVDKSLKGKCHYSHIRMNFGGGQAWHPEAIRKHLVVGAPAIIFYNAGRQSQTYLNRFFFQLYGDPNAAPDKAWWNFTHIEIRMNRTFNGSVPELSDLVQKILAGKSKAPPPDAKVPPMDPAAMKALPAPGEAVDESKLPAAFVKREAKIGTPRPADAPAKTAPGLKAEYYEGQWTALPDFNALKPAKTATAAVIDNTLRSRELHFGLRFTGYVQVAKDGVYTFYTISNDGSKLFIGSTEVVNNDHHHGAIEQSGEINLKAGLHALTVVYFQEGGNTVLDVQWEGPDLPKQKIPA
ncbi:MAG TPA: PA14 domain-containing protein, partial [Planctomycetota bacterium]|nr:PA14 domain-containing protein [Planctomycetota bacterium]